MEIENKLFLGDCEEELKLIQENSVGRLGKTRLNNLSETDKRRDESAVGSGFGEKISNCLVRDKAFPANVLHLGTECS
jgi:hypothetical protein